MGAHSCSLKEPIKLLTQKGAPLSRKVRLPMLAAKVLTPDLVALYGKYFEDNYRLVEKVKFDVARAAELFRVDVAVLVSEIAHQEKYIEMQVELMRDWHPTREKRERWERLMEHVEDTRDAVSALRRRFNSVFEGNGRNFHFAARKANWYAKHAAETFEVIMGEYDRTSNAERAIGRLATILSYTTNGYRTVGKLIQG